MSIYKDFVPYNESLELKDLGFDEPTLYHWHNSCNTHPFTNEVFNPNCRPTTNSGIRHIGEENHTWSAPTFSQAFRWFREKHNLNGGIQYIGGLRPETTWWDIYVVGHFNTVLSKMKMKYQPYEEAELALLKQLIKIIDDNFHEMVKDVQDTAQKGEHKLDEWAQAYAEKITKNPTYQNYLRKAYIDGFWRGNSVK